ncbi:hypothetical protein RRF57_006605 [Xylaria bambusicola]|uniref:Uncharacterized protein n=1 Tax=Xylaria bambusicola TaxID=326684 RepID=A0AAN7YZ19_9PEZI
MHFGVGSDDMQGYGLDSFMIIQRAIPTCISPHNLPLRPSTLMGPRLLLQKAGAEIGLCLNLFLVIIAVTAHS